jgi:hypothetical protein
MPPLQQQREQHIQTSAAAIENVARSLSRLLQAAATHQLLQQALPAGPLTAAQQQLVWRCADAAVQLSLEVTMTPALLLAAAGAATTRAAVLGRTMGLALRHHAVRNVGVLLVWLQQQPQLLQFELEVQRQSRSDVDRSPPTTAYAWIECCDCLAMMTGALKEVCSAGRVPGGCNAAALAAAMLQQLEQSGWLRQ